MQCSCWPGLRAEDPSADPARARPLWPEFTPAVHLVAGLAESTRRLAHPRAAGLPADETPLRPPALRDHLAAQLRRSRHRGRRVGRPLGRDAHAGLRAVRGRPRRRLDRPYGRGPSPGGGPMIWGAYGAQNSSQGGMRRRDASENDIHVIRITAGQRTYGPATKGRPQQDSNLRSRTPEGNSI